MITLLSIFLITASSDAAEAVKLQPQKPIVEANEYLYEIKNNEIMVNDKLITLFAFSKDGISVSYRNKTEKSEKPKYIFKAYNPYGMLVGVYKVGDSIGFLRPSTRMEPGAVSSEKLYLKPFPLDKILKYACIEQPSDLNQIKWIVLSDTNSK